ncbi:MAG: hypothetical protein M3Q56_09290 [Bacteroidota bacterium]|nr:hypothetical protein [Bacteroidota bacterium]
MKDQHSNSEMKTLVSTLNTIIKKGYTEDYKVNELGLEALRAGNVYSPAEVKVVDFYRFEGTSDPGDESILYVIETQDNGKGTLVDAFGPSGDLKVTRFMQLVEEISKKEAKK